MSDLRIIEPRSPSELEAFRRLSWEYRAFLMALPEPDVELARMAYPEDRYRSILDAGETANRPPNGMMRLALKEDFPAGCGTVQSLGDGDAEIKRVYIADAARGLGAGRRMMGQLIEDCRNIGFRRILMDTARPLAAAIALYDDMGFQRRGPYQDMPPEAEGIMIYFEMTLD